MTTSNYVTETEAINQKAFHAYFCPGKYKAKLFEEATLESGHNSRIQFADGELAVTTWGNGPAVLLVHGWGGSRTQMTGFVEPLLAAGFRVVAFDQPAHGDSTGELTNLFEMASAMELIAERKGIFHAIIAHSFGTLLTSYALVNRNFPPPARLVYFGAHNRLADTLPRFQAMVNFPDAVIEELREFINNRFGKDALLSIANETLAPKINIPTLMFHDITDKVTPIEESRAIAQVWKSARLIETVGLSHVSVLQSNRIHDQVVMFLAI
jgi:pimeloyl-ACP methyl ester carboxylesterase